MPFEMPQDRLRYLSTNGIDNSRNSQKNLFICLFAGLLLLMLWGTTWGADYAYVSDVTEITLRRGPGTEFKVMKMLKSGERMKVLGAAEVQGWSNVELEDGTTGFVLSRYLTAQEPFSRKSRSAVEENDKLNNRVKELTAENERLGGLNSDVTAKLASAMGELKKALAELEQLKNDSKDVVKVRTELQAVKKQYDELEDRYRKAALVGEEGEEKHLWILFGAGVLVFGMIVGSLSRRSSGSYAKLR